MLADAGVAVAVAVRHSYWDLDAVRPDPAQVNVDVVGAELGDSLGLDVVDVHAPAQWDETGKRWP